MPVRRLALGLGFSLLLVVAAVASEPGPAVRPIGEAERRFAEALLAFRAGDWDEAVRGFRSAAERSALLADYARFFLAESLSRLGDLAEARQVAASIPREHPGSPVAPHALLLASALAAREGDEPAREALLRRFLSEFGHRPESPLVRYLLGQSIEGQGRGQDAARVFRELWLLAPGSAYGAAAGDHVERLARAGIALPSPTASERLDRAERLLATGIAATARDEAEALLLSDQAPETAVRALRVVAEAWRRLGRYDAAALALERALGRAPAEGHPVLLLEMARFQARAGSREAALRSVDRLLRARHAEREAPHALLLKGQILEDTGKLADAALTYERVAREFTDDEAAGVALWRLGWQAFNQGDVATAGRRFGALDELPAAHGYRLAATYWAGRSWAGLGDEERARRFYAAVIKRAPRSYYGLLAARRTQGVRIDPGRAAGPPLPPDPFIPLAGDLRVVRAEVLRGLGLSEFALAELGQILETAADDLGKLYAVSALHVKHEQYHLALRILRRHFADLAAGGSPALPRAFWEMLYPVGWARELRAASVRAGLDPYLVAAVVREESSFFPLARSRVGARGLMQLMPETVRRMAGRQGGGLDRGDLLDLPEANLRLGATLLAGFIKEFGDPRLATAAYNAGPARVRSWWAARRSDDMEAFVEQIPFDETRHFVKRVMVAWEEYRRIYVREPASGSGGE